MAEPTAKGPVKKAANLISNKGQLFKYKGMKSPMSQLKQPGKSSLTGFLFYQGIQLVGREPTYIKRIQSALFNMQIHSNLPRKHPHTHTTRIAFDQMHRHCPSCIAVTMIKDPNKKQLRGEIDLFSLYNSNMRMSRQELQAASHITPAVESKEK